MDHDDNPNYRPVDHALSVVPASSRLRQVSEFPDRPELEKGLCASCRDSGFVHEKRAATWGVKTERDGRLMRCLCRHGDRKRNTKTEWVEA